MVEKSDKSTLRRLSDWAEALSSALAGASDRLADGDSVEAEKRAKAISAVAKAVREVAELDAAARAETPEEDVETVRAELRRRIARFVAAEHAGPVPEGLQRLADTGRPE